MKKEDKNQMIESLANQLVANPNFYIADISNLNSEATSKLRRLCFKKEVKLIVVKNALLKKAMEKTNQNFESLYDVLKGGTCIMFAEVANQPAKLIQEFRRSSNRPILKGAFIEEMVYVGDNQLDNLVNIKSKNELIGDVIGLLQSPMRNILSALQSGGHTISGLVKTLSEKSETAN
ncbi:MAG: 50S ribosomal protein L10 [Bacteroidetes bacterium]|nr:50S ribosomal protein L10 [Bacteroidota bacterium]